MQTWMIVVGVLVLAGVVFGLWAWSGPAGFDDKDEDDV